MRPVNYMNKIIYKNLDFDPPIDINFKSIIINEENLKSYFYELIEKRRSIVYLYLVIPSNDSIKEIIQKIKNDRYEFRSEIYIGTRKFICEHSLIESINSFNYKPSCVKMIRKDWFDFKIECFIKCLVTIHSLKIEGE